MVRHGGRNFFASFAVQSDCRFRRVATVTEHTRINFSYLAHKLMFLKVFVIGEKGIMRWTLTAAGQYCARGDTEWCVLTMQSMQFRLTFSAGFGVPYPSDSPHMASREHGANRSERVRRTPRTLLRRRGTQVLSLRKRREMRALDRKKL